ncbi:retrovirus-related Pol polyprotein from transposon 412 [Trichonephila clavipes]|uniref:RNA-directed DNA polymerase n=1 Tax=Trichonephila clavipes TaxID=2585209 RepID=A0A8X6VJ92_TRICX|nr:retrovirus-related Pol polyprotein from transposon 412 [Trichonephila clavipes]
MYVVDHTLPYLILELPELSQFKLTINCSHLQIKQIGNIVNKVNKYKNEQKYFLHINEETKETKKQPPHSQISEDQNVLPQIVIENRCELREILSHYDSIFSKDKYGVGQLRVEPQRIILKSDLPVHLRPYRISPIQEKEIKGQIEKSLQAGLIKESNSPYSASVTLAFKRDEGKKTRLCIDFRKLNALRKADSEPLPIMDSLLDKLARAKFFSTLDLASGYCMYPFTQRILSNSLYALTLAYVNGANYHLEYYFDDIIAFFLSEKEHWNHLKTIYDICQKENIKLKLSICVFAQTKINFLGYEIKRGKVTPNNTNIDIIKKLKPPNNVKELQRFLGSINVCPKFIPEYADLRYPLNMLLKNNVKFNWTDECHYVFEKLKESLIMKPILHLYDPD